MHNFRKYPWGSFVHNAESSKNFETVAIATSHSGPPVL